MTMAWHQRWLGAALAATLLATAYTAWRGDGEVAGPVPARPLAAGTRPTPAAVVDPVPATGSTGRRAWPEVDETALAAWGQTRRPPPPAPSPVAALALRAAASAAGAAPAAPPFNYRYVGRLVEDGRTRALLVSPQRTQFVAERDVLDGQWQVERIAERALDLVWLPGPLPRRVAIQPS